MRKSNYDKFPFVSVPNSADACVTGWDAISERLCQAVARRTTRKTILVVECYTGVHEDEVLRELKSRLKPVLALRAADTMLSSEKIDALVTPFLGGNDPVFGFLSGLTLPEFFDKTKFQRMRQQVEKILDGLVLVVGCGARLTIGPTPTAVAPEAFGYRGERPPFQPTAPSTPSFGRSKPTATIVVDKPFYTPSMQPISRRNCITAVKFPSGMVPASPFFIACPSWPTAKFMSAPNSGCPPTALTSFLPNRLSPPAAKSTHLRSWSPWLIQPRARRSITLLTVRYPAPIRSFTPVHSPSPIRSRSMSSPQS